MDQGQDKKSIQETSINIYIQIKESVFDLINVLSNLEEQELRSLSGLLDFSTQGFDNLEK